MARASFSFKLRRLVGLLGLIVAAGVIAQASAFRLLLGSGVLRRPIAPVDFLFDWVRIVSAVVLAIGAIRLLTRGRGVGLLLTYAWLWVTTTFATAFTGTVIAYISSGLGPVRGSLNVTVLRDFSGLVTSLVFPIFVYVTLRWPEMRRIRIESCGFQPVFGPVATAPLIKQVVPVLPAYED